MEHPATNQVAGWLLAAVIGGPIAAGGLAWAVPRPAWRRVVILLAALMVAVNGVALSLQSPAAFRCGSLLRGVAHLSEVGMVLAVLALGIYRRIWWVAAMGVAQAGLVICNAWLGSANHESPGFLLDPLSSVMVLIVSLVGALILVYAVGYMDRHAHHAPPAAASTGRFYFFLIGFLGLMNGLVLTDHLTCLSVFWEGTTLCSFFLIGQDGTSEALKNARRALVINTAGGTALMLGLVIETQRGGTGTVASVVEGGSLLALALLLLAAFTKSAQLPFQSWLLGAMVAPTPVSALLHSSTMVKAGSYLVLRLAPGFVASPLAPVVAAAGGFTFAAASAMAISQGNAKKVLAYSTIANLGLIVACSGVNTPLAYAAALIILICHAISKALLFLSVGTIEQQIGSRQIDDMSGILFKMPLTTTLAVLGMVSMMAPPFGMLIGKWMAIIAVAYSPLVLVLLVLGSALTIFFWGKWMGRIITTSYHERYVVESLPATMKWTLIGLAAAVLLAGAGTMTLYQHWIRPVAVATLVNERLQENATLLLKSVDDFLEWPILLIFAVVIGVTLASLAGLRRTNVRLPYLGGENAGAGARSFEFRSVMDQKSAAQVTSYYLEDWFGEATLTRWANPIALLILLTLFARLGWL